LIWTTHVDLYACSYLGREGGEALYEQALRKIENTFDIYDAILTKQEYLAGCVCNVSTSLEIFAHSFFRISPWLTFSMFRSGKRYIPLLLTCSANDPTLQGTQLVFLLHLTVSAHMIAVVQDGGRAFQLNLRVTLLRKP